ncbi:caspase family protein [Paracoccus aerius]|uniref:caspase family protein n=1 Tax=Paracoccus aerius TaxID=1915382 RepID=UPI0036091A5F
MSKVTLEELNRLAADPEADLSPYFIHDEARSGPFNPEMRLNPQTVDIPPDLGPTRSAGLVNAGNWLERRRRAGRYYAMIAKGYNGPLVVAEGDSWWQYPFLLRDTIDWLSDSCAIFCVSAAGDLLEDMARKREYLDAVAETGAGILLLSGGGNDLVAGGSLQDYLEDYDVDLKPTDYLKPSFPDLLDRAFGYYERIFTEVRNAFPHVHIICHGYDYPIPAAGKWLGKPMAKRNILNPKLQRQIAVHMVDIFNIGLRRVVRRVPGVTYLDLRGTVADHQWHDELHPSNEGYRLVAKKFAREINKAANRVVDPVRSIAGPFAVSADTEAIAGLVAAPALTGKAVRTRSLHLGLNFVNPAAYSGWDGALRACVNDAQAMAGLAQAQGFDAQTLIDREATHDAVVAAVKAAATELREGDMFLWSVSCHGMQVRDYNRDETDDGDQPMDEALALWDMPLVDDNIYRLWSSFAPGVRILMIPDTCHSGTMTRRSFLSPEEVEALIRPRSAPKIILEPVQFRFMPDQVQARVLAENDARYRDHAREYHDFGEAATLRSSIPPVTASVVSISACQDNQLAQDGTQYGAFTGALLKVWGNGRFQGTYSEFHRQISETMANPDQLPKLYETGAKDLAFLVQRPFSPAGSAATAAGARPHTAPASASSHQMTESPADVLIATEGNENDPLDGVDQGIWLPERGLGGPRAPSLTALSARLACTI